MTQIKRLYYLEISCERTNICDMHATCQVGEGGHSMCVCNNGYEGDGTTCTQTGECMSDLNCGQNERCVFNETSYMNTCTCLEGYQKYENKCQRTSRKTQLHFFSTNNINLTYLTKIRLFV